MTARRITRARVRTARRSERIAISSPGDFRVDAPELVDGVTDETLLPYCLDVLKRRSLYVGGVEARDAQAAPFYYLHLRRHAQTIVSVPWEAGPLRGGARCAPIFLFSPGRCGSTLLSRILSDAGLGNVSEPDFYTQLTSAAAASPFNPWRAAMAGAVANMGSDLAAALGPSPVVKLRAESCRAPGLLVQQREPRTLFMTRGFESWARSNGRAFRNGPHKTVGKYLRALAAHAWLRRSSTCHLIRYEDLLGNAAAEVTALGAFLGHRIRPDIAMATMKEDSQGGTPLEQGARPDQPGWERRFDATMALWNSDRVRQARDRLGVDESRAG
ncbi:MAG: hypothetical protein WDN03_16500 [Rhizomicrobium sp.]